VFGVLIALVIAIALIAMVTWFPGVVDAVDRHNATVRSVVFGNVEIEALSGEQ
jgi:hypothetical protein